MSNLTNQARDILGVINVAEGHGITPNFTPLIQTTIRLADALDTVDRRLARIERLLLESKGHDPLPEITALRTALAEAPTGVFGEELASFDSVPS